MPTGLLELQDAGIYHCIKKKFTLYFAELNHTVLPINYRTQFETLHYKHRNK